MSSSRVIPEVQRSSAQPPWDGEFPSPSGQPWTPKPCPMTKASLPVHTWANIPMCSGPMGKDEDLILASLLWRLRKCP